MNLREIADLFERLTLLFELKGENPFKIRALEQAVRTLRGYEGDALSFLEDAQAKRIKGFGPQLTEYLVALVDAGTLPVYESLRTEFPPTLFDLFALQGLGAKKIKLLYEQLGIGSIGQLKEAATGGQIARLKGFGTKTEQNFLAAIERYEEYQGQVLFPVAEKAAFEVLSWVQASPLCIRAQIAGSVRRKKEIARDIDLVVSTEEANANLLMAHFTSMEGVKTVLGSGETKSSVVLSNGLQADLRVVRDEQFGTAILHFTGSKEHNTQLRSLAKQKNAKLSEYGLFIDEKPLPLKTEAETYAALDLCYIEPELREGLGEIEKAAAHYAAGTSFPRLVEVGDLQGILHAHSTYSDGKVPLEQLAKTVQQKGYGYLGITDHSRSAAYAGGLSIEAIQRQHEEIDALNAKLAPFVIFKGIESDILADGSLDYPDEVLSTFDFVIASIHSQLTMGEAEMTARLVRAASNPYTTILGHPSGRLLLRREAYAFNVTKVVAAAAAAGVCIEINANPRRLDLDWRFVRTAATSSMLFPVCPDAHSSEEIDYVRYGIGIARKGGLGKEQVLNTLNVQEIAAYFAKRKNR